MAGMGPAPKPDAERRRTNAPSFEWKILPTSHDIAAPELPEWRIWQDRTREWWTNLWAKPQATQWVADGSTLFSLALLMDDVIAGRTDVNKASPEIRQHEDRHGLNPKAMLQLRWRIDEPPAAEESAARPRRKVDARRKRALKVIEGDGV